MDKPLPPLEDGDSLATDDMFLPLTDDCFKPIPGSPGMEARDLGYVDNGDGGLSMVMFRSSGETMIEPSLWHMHDLNYHLGYIVRGWAVYEFEGIGRRRVEAGTAIHHKTRNRLRIIELSNDFEGIWIKSPHADRVHVFIPNATTGDYIKTTI